MNSEKIKPGKATKKARGTVSKGPKATKDYAANHGINRGGTAGDDAVPSEGKEPVLDVEADDEGLLVFMQTRQCRRKIWATVFESPLSALVPGNLTVPSKPRMRARGAPDYKAQAELCKWRRLVFGRDHAMSQLDASAILDQSVVTTLTTLGPLTSEQVVALLKGSWIWWDRYGDELTAVVVALDIVYRPLKKSVGSKRSSGEANAAVYPDASSPKRPRLEIDAAGSNMPSASGQSPVPSPAPTVPPSTSSPFTTSFR
ncbi:hypothetical protein BN946_scf184601.g27 [Trametes cinnabarina]|uniref:Uncharacterized protein n=1 Tax=Pycnoporus cinnabarinus TaxID=5643 RepID=A0A060SCR1_PYCCI|nr:hypothetical protein BN946_scf184601.g27 [Trametes cinnabarina]